eukprot:SM000127S26608  [mRNA]  locus=s127:10752:14375:+ [translate_table: standard]
MAGGGENPLPRTAQAYHRFLPWLDFMQKGDGPYMLVFMVQYYGVAGTNEHAVGRYAGLLASLLPMSQFTTSMLWGTISDRSGRKPWLAFGNIVCTVAALLLGFCEDYLSACTVRVIGGLFNGVMTITKSTLAEICDKTNQSRGFALLSLAWGIGSVAGPVLSGLLAQPCEQYNISKCPHIFRQHPFLLPCIIAAIISLAAIVSSLLLEETSPASSRNYSKLIDQDQSDQDDAAEMAVLVEVNDGDAKAIPPLTRESAISHARDDNHIYVSTMPVLSEASYALDTSRSPSEKTALLALPQMEVDLAEAAAHMCADERGLADSNRLPSKTATVAGPGQRCWDEVLSVWRQCVSCCSSPTDSLLQDRDVMISSLCYSCTGLIFIMTDELFPIFGAASTQVGGLGFSSAKIGFILGEGGVVLFLYTLLLFPPVARRLGPLRCFRYGILASVPLWVAFPATSSLSGYPFLQVVLLLLVTALRSIAACTAFTGVLVLVSNSATATNMGAVTGLSMSLCSFFRAVGPAFGGVVWSVSSQQTFPLHQYLAWLVVAAATSLTYTASFALSPSLNEPKVAAKF